jgi:hypothetical protein
VRITITIIIGGRITIGIICIRIMRITMRITIGFTITSITTRITILKRTMTSGLTVVRRGRQTHGRTLRCSSLTLQRDENQREHGKL